MGLAEAKEIVRIGVAKGISQRRACAVMGLNRSSVFIVGAGGPGGDSGPCAAQGSEVSNRATGKSSAVFFMVLQCLLV